MSAVDYTLEAMRAELAAIRALVVCIPTIATAVEALQRDMRELHRDLRMVRAAVGNLARIDVTTGEVEVLHDAIDRVQEQQAKIEARVAVLERGPAP